MEEYYRLLLGEQPPDDDPMGSKRALARRLVERFHGEGSAGPAEAHFDRLHVDRELPEEIEEASFEADGPVHLPALLESQFGLSRSEGRRLITQGGVRLDGRVISPQELDVEPSVLDGAVLQVGKRRHRRLRASK